MARILIVGAGAMGSLFGAALTRAGHTVWLVSHWTEHVARIRTLGLAVRALDGSAYRVEVPILLPDDPLPPDIEIAFVSVKSRQTEEAATYIQRALSPDGIAITMQNGIGNWEVLAEYVGQERAFLGVTSHGATLIEPGAVRHTGQGATTLATQPDYTKASMLEEILTRAGFVTTLDDNIEQVVWHKLLVNVGINALTAILNVPNGFLTENEAAQTLLRDAVTEAVQVATAKGIPLTGDAIERTLTVAQNTAPNVSSMLADVRRGVPTEIDVMNGAIVREGERLGVPTPINRTLTALVHAIEAQGVGGTEFSTYITFK